MIGIDTNVLLRAVAIDDPIQTSKAREFLSRECTPEEPGFIATLVLLEAAWVLESAYGFGRAQLADLVEGLLSVPEFRVEHADAVRAMLSLFRNHPGDFADALIGAVNRAAGCTTTATFDRRAGRLPGSKRLV
jgi:predicted nucleic-acid-binding protein